MQPPRDGWHHHGHQAPGSRTAACPTIGSTQDISSLRAGAKSVAPGFAPDTIDIHRELVDPLAAQSCSPRLPGMGNVSPKMLPRMAKIEFGGRQAITSKASFTKGAQHLRLLTTAIQAGSSILGPPPAP